MSIDPTATPPLAVITFERSLVAVHAHTGQRVWMFELPFKEKNGLLRVEQTWVLYVGKRALLCLDYLRGTFLWQQTLPMIPSNLMSLAGVALVTGLGEVAAFALHDGRPLWHEPFKGLNIYGGAMAAPGVAAPIDRYR